MINLIGRWQVGLGVLKRNGKHTCSFLFVMSIGLNEFKIALKSLFCINLSYCQVPLDEHV